MTLVQNAGHKSLPKEADSILSPGMLVCQWSTCQTCKLDATVTPWLPCQRCEPDDTVTQCLSRQACKPTSTVLNPTV
ncbi:hypothetical protein CHS0354_041494 [Potamilus streckersoni]|uniref:Uncharacterized protein n=1 Tax=Potamilus streckersoni TaxID=2493646 RepID=A0AAE0TAZ1_9BIVA|nr:hypothetical protein CHS0354_041494 [Potamilus streckersoni]